MIDIAKAVLERIVSLSQWGPMGGLSTSALQVAAAWGEVDCVRRDAMFLCFRLPRRTSLTSPQAANGAAQSRPCKVGD